MPAARLLTLTAIVGALGCAAQSPSRPMAAELRALPVRQPACPRPPDDMLQWEPVPAELREPGAEDLRPRSVIACTFPREAKADDGRVSVLLRIDETGRSVATALACEIPIGDGFGAAARACVGRLRYAPGRDFSGKPVADTLQFNIRFTR